MNDFFKPRAAKPKADSAQKSAEVDHSAYTPWIEKYRPKKVDDVAYQDEVVAVLKKVLGGADLPHLLFYGPPGTGKTSAALAMCRQLFKTPEVFRDRLLELNASDERGIQVVRTRIKEFSQRSIGPSSLGGSVGQMKIIILDEADAMTSVAQAAMRRTIEKYSHTTRFILICNYISRIIDPLTSRCAKFRFKPLPVEKQLERLQFICKEEKVNLDEEALKTLVQLTEGDLRKAVTYLQSLASSNTAVDSAFIRNITGRIDDQVIDDILAVLRSKDVNAVIKLTEKLRQQGYGGRQIILQLYEPLLTTDDLTDMCKAEVFEKMAEIECRLMDGADDFLQTMSLLVAIHEQYRKVNN
ncbi:hypothetical protein WR25_23821 [Diploscapter pachys]|uniref:AAA+ ATPase domain-containing protein n=1 Tax=Diploscapter pachys TaxID=2018661 RepID=A0A2A2J8E4_9BILA|nr:hypothetical protein WR25_23821 [Diploscapter pachys]